MATRRCPPGACYSGLHEDLVRPAWRASSGVTTRRSSTSTLRLTSRSIRVMADSYDLVESVHEFRQLVNVKGE
jgi:hypothetical protein